jgi:hypothetical protein
MPTKITAVTPLPGVMHSGLGHVANRPAKDTRLPGQVTNTVQEHVMMMLASLGLIALGVAVRRRRY